MSVIERERVVTRADVLTHAADILEEFEWEQQGGGSRKTGRMCAVAAILEAGNDLVGRGSCGIGDPVRDAMLIHGSNGEGAIVPLATWNDEPGRTKAEVVAELRRYAMEDRDA